MAPMSSPKKSKSTSNRRDSEKLDELLGVFSKLSDDVKLMRKHMEEKDKLIRLILNLLEEARNPPAVVPSADFQASCCCRSSLNQAESSKRRTTRLHLSFVCKLPTKLFTANLIYAIDDDTKTNVPVRVVLLDEGNNVVSEDLFSSLKIEVFAVYGDFEAEDWTAKELETSRVPAREDKGSLLLGCSAGIMKNGVCTFNDLKFGDNSSWVRCKKFKLVAKVTESPQLEDMVEIRPAVSGPFSVKDQRGKQYEKHSVPSPDDEVWRLNRIGRDGPYHKKLEEEGIKTVEDFLQQYYIDQSSLQKRLGAKDGTWATIVEHAKQCNPNNAGFQYSSHKPKVELLFNCFYKLVSVSFDNQNAVSLETLSESDKVRVLFTLVYIEMDAAGKLRCTLARISYHCYSMRQRHVEQVRRCALEDQSKLVRINSLTGWPSAKAIPFAGIKTQDPQNHVDAPPQQGELVENELLINLPGYPQTPLFIIGDLLQEEQTAAQSNAAIDDFSFMETDPSFWDSVPVDYQNHPFQNPLNFEL